MPARLESATLIVAVSVSGVFFTDAPSRSSAGRFEAAEVLAHVASPAVSDRPPVGTETLIVPVPFNDGPVIIFETSTNGPFLPPASPTILPSLLLLSMKTTVARPSESIPRSIMSTSERSPVHGLAGVQVVPQVVPEVQMLAVWTMR